MLYKFSGPREQLPATQMPWFATPMPRWRDHRIVFGHWSALGLHREADCVCLDTGCVWGGSLTALRVEDDHIAQVPAAEPPLRP